MGAKQLKVRDPFLMSSQVRGCPSSLSLAIAKVLWGVFCSFLSVVQASHTFESHVFSVGALKELESHLCKLIITWKGEPARSHYLLAVASAFRPHSFQYICLQMFNTYSCNVFLRLLAKLYVFCETFLFPSLIVLFLCIFRFSCNCVAGLVT